MARAQAKVTKTKLFAEGVTELLWQDGVAEYLLEVGEEIVRDIETASGLDEYRAEIYRGRKHAIVVNVLSDSDHALNTEAKHGYLAKHSAKKRS